MLLNRNETLVMYGDSITDCGRSRPRGIGGLNTTSLGTGYVNLVAGQLCACYPELNLRVFNKGIGGNKTRDLIARFDTDVVPEAPDMISVLIGINDIWGGFMCRPGAEDTVLTTADEFEANLETLVERCLSLTDRVVLMTPYFMELSSTDVMRRCVNGLVERTRAVAERHGLILVDLQKEFDDLLLRVGSSYFLSGDRVHPNTAGHTVIARSFLKAIGADACV